MSMADEIQKLSDLKESGAITEEEFEDAKANLLAKDGSLEKKMGGIVDDISGDENTLGLILHLSQFCGYLVPIAGLLVPIVLWQIKKDESKVIDKHGTNVANWMLTELIMAIGFGILCFIFIGFPLFLALMVAGIVFPIIGGLKAKEGEIWKYPCSIQFFSVKEDVEVVAVGEEVIDE